jgi:type IV pilus assembly protein PilW
MTERHCLLRRQRGVTLIELLVGIVIALMSVVLITQVMAVAEGQKRSATEGSDAQTNGALALYTVQRDVQGAGYGIVNTVINALGCPVRAQFGGADFTFNLNPLTITDGGVDGNGASLPDRIEFNASTRAGVTGTRITADHPPQAANFFVQSSLGVRAGDLMVAVPATFDSSNWCTLFNVSTDPGAGNQNGNGQGQGLNQIIHNSGQDGPWNQPGGQNIMPAGGYAAGSSLINLGTWVNRTYQISTGRMLQMSEFNSTAPGSPTVSELFPEIVNLQALYGKDTDGDGDVDRFDSATPATNSAWRQVIAVRIALLSRSAQYEKEGDVTTVQPVWNLGAAPAVTGSATCGSSQCLTMRVDDLPDWQRYRYKLFDVVVPLRNVMWGG